MACCQRVFTGSASIVAQVCSKFSTCMDKKSSWSRRKMEYSEMPARLRSASISGHTSLWAWSYASSVPGRNRRRNATLCIITFDGLFRLRNEAKIRLGRFPAVGILELGFFVGDRGEDDDIIAQLPIRWGGHLVFGGQLH